MSITTTEMRKEMKSVLGYNANQVTIKADSPTSYKFTVRSIDVNFKAVEEFSSRYESIRYDERTSEILCGGNTFVFVEIDMAKLVPMAREKYLDLLTPALNIMKLGSEGVMELIKGVANDTMYLEKDNEYTCVLRKKGTTIRPKFLLDSDDSIGRLCVALWSNEVVCNAE